jgi:hypothetical protein
VFLDYGVAKLKTVQVKMFLTGRDEAAYKLVLFAQRPVQVGINIRLGNAQHVSQRRDKPALRENLGRSQPPREPALIPLRLSSRKSITFLSISVISMVKMGQ